jgi:hypothetical protein
MSYTIETLHPAITRGGRARISDELLTPEQLATSGFAYSLGTLPDKGIGGRGQSSLSIALREQLHLTPAAEIYAGGLSRDMALQFF